MTGILMTWPRASHGPMSRIPASAVYGRPSTAATLRACFGLRVKGR